MRLGSQSTKGEKKGRWPKKTERINSEKVIHGQVKDLTTRVKKTKIVCSVKPASERQRSRGDLIF